MDPARCPVGRFQNNNCNVGDITGMGNYAYYYTADSNQAGYANNIFEAVGVKSDAKDIFITPTKGAVLSDVCSQLRGDDPLQQELLIFDTVGMFFNPSTGVSAVGTPLEGQYPYYLEDGRRSNGVTLYTLNEEESKGCKGYMISFGMVITAYAGGQQFTEATPYLDPWFNNTQGCQYVILASTLEKFVSMKTMPLRRSILTPLLTPLLRPP